MDCIRPVNRVILFEPRALVQKGICLFLRDQQCEIVHCWSLEQLSAALYDRTDARKILLAGIGGLGKMLPGFIRTLHYPRAMLLTSFVYLSSRDALLTKMLLGAGADVCLDEAELESSLLAQLAAPVTAQRRDERLTASELNILLDYACGMQAREIAAHRKCSYKTVFTFKRNARLRLNIENGFGWRRLMLHLSLLISRYE
ncbi:LuxR C-terminal-related transcriptional regulator [Enterobacter sp. E-TC7]|uniref:LuxR C-terminal-related transcriptional regulator n=1 Tax=Enterobacter nematophilus TaxID=2994648 RepID=A0ABT3W309_9ENTR|nr:LuxR C-terminal-related transcriptional regulator [Enterobacter nematophilus]MCX5574506.1 LuxR C-terminal-related transcriptional regulator [Enterobacter nematophilus]